MKKEIKLLDGSLSYPLEKKGYNLNKKLWTGDALINNPNVIKKIHKDYLVAGVDFISIGTVTKDIRSIDLSLRFVS